MKIDIWDTEILSLADFPRTYFLKVKDVPV